jgi:dihydroneopterin aldolase
MNAILQPLAGTVNEPSREPGFAGAALDQVFIEGLTAHTVIGIHDNELHVPQPVVIDVSAGVARARACDTDRIGDTLDYSQLRERILRLMAEHRVQLLEALAEQIAHIVLYEFRALWVRVRLAKPRKFDDVQAVGVLIERHRAPLADAAQLTDAAQRGAAVLHVIGAGMVPGA